MELSEIKSKLNAKDKFGKVSRRIKKNDVIADYYMQLYDETEDETLPRWADRIKSCCKLWDEEYNRIIDVLRELESPERVFEYLTEIQSQLQTKEVTYISRASVAQLMADDYGE